MSVSLKEIQTPIALELKEFEQHFREVMSSHIPLLDKVTRYIVKRKGKQIRPMFVLLSARLVGDIKPATYTAASLVELLHTATLIHDDVVDDSMERRGFFSINALWKNKIAVLVGDYLLSKGLLLALDNFEYQLLQVLSRAVREMSEGELLQIEKARRLDIEESVYYEIITKKTASLIASSCMAGAASAGGSEAQLNAIYKLGEAIGIAFQIRDDLFDFGHEYVGKPLGIDIKERKMTLPLIYALNHTDLKQRRRIISLIKNDSENVDAVHEVLQFVRNSDGLEYTRNAMYKYRDKAFKLIEPFNDSPAAESLRNLIIYVTERKK
jgi:octaprenyl-diphosphate synthase